MVILRLQGGLGNQLFQLALALSLEHRLHQSVVFDMADFEHDKLRIYELDCFGDEFSNATHEQVSNVLKVSSIIPNRLVLWLIRRGLLNRKAYINEVNYDAVLSSIDPRADYYFDGYWQSDRYFNDVEQKIQSLVKPKYELPKSALKYLEKIKRVNSVCVHVRRGDYLQDSKTNSVHGVIGMGYYTEAIERLSNDLEDIELFVFSDDVGWIKENMIFDDVSTTIVEEKFDRPCIDLYLMSRCKHFIIANSSFSWWAAYLSQNKTKTIIAPKQWFANKSLNESASNIVPETWVRI